MRMSPNCAARGSNTPPRRCASRPPCGQPPSTPTSSSKSRPGRALVQMAKATLGPDWRPAIAHRRLRHPRRGPQPAAARRGAARARRWTCNRAPSSAGSAPASRCLPAPCRSSATRSSAAATRMSPTSTSTSTPTPRLWSAPAPPSVTGVDLAAEHQALTSPAPLHPEPAGDRHGYHRLPLPRTGRRTAGPGRRLARASAAGPLHRRPGRRRPVAAAPVAPAPHRSPPHRPTCWPWSQASSPTSAPFRATRCARTQGLVTDLGFDSLMFSRCRGETEPALADPRQDHPGRGLDRRELRRRPRRRGDRRDRRRAPVAQGRFPR